MRVLERHRGPRLAWELHRPSGTPRGSLLVLHGYKDHSTRYLHAIERWVERGWLVGRFDLRGHGHSAGTRGAIRCFDDYLDDLSDVLDALHGESDWAEWEPPLLFGHSMGGLLAMEFALRYANRVRALALSSPFFALAMKPPRWKLSLGNALARTVPDFGLPSGLEVSMQTRCPEMQRQALEDPLRFSLARARWFTETARAQEAVVERAHELQVPAFCLASGADRVADVERTRHVLGVLPHAQLHILPDHEHEVLHELERAKHIERYADWFEAEGTSSSRAVEER